MQLMIQCRGDNPMTVNSFARGLCYMSREVKKVKDAMTKELQLTYKILNDVERRTGTEHPHLKQGASMPLESQRKAAPVHQQFSSQQGFPTQAMGAAPPPSFPMQSALMPPPTAPAPLPQ